MTVQAAGCRPIGRGSPRGPGLRGRGRRRGLQRDGESLQLPKAEGGWVEAATPHCRCAFDVAQAVGQRKPELPSVAPCINATQSSMGSQKMWSRGGVGRKSRHNVSAGDEREFVPRLLPTHPSSILSLWEGFSVWGAGCYSLFYVLTSMRRRSPSGVSVTRETGD